MSARPFLRALAGAALVGAGLGAMLGLALLVWDPGRPHRDPDLSNYTLRECKGEPGGPIRCEVIRVR